jgi:formylmethanofuran dehydrogenase subunit E-like metal-binding protein
MKKLVVIKVCMALIFAVICISCTNTTEVTVIRVYQPLVSGMVHTYIEVEFEDKTKSSVVLPDDDAVWDKAKKSKKAKVRKLKDKWVFDSFVE